MRGDIRGWHRVCRVHRLAWCMCRVFHEGVLVTSFLFVLNLVLALISIRLYILTHGDAQGEAGTESNKMYEWETQVDRNAIEINKINMRNEIKRINEVVRSGNFVKQEDREYWMQKAKQLNSKLSALEEAYK